MWRVVVAALSLSATLIVMALLTAPSSAMAVTAAPAWRIEAVPNPTAFSMNDVVGPEHLDQYEILVTNIGGTPIDEEAVTVTDTLPHGVRTSRTAGNKEEFWECTPTGAGQTVVTCTISAELLHKLKPGVSEALSQLPALTVYVEVESGVPANSTLTNSVKVEGGGAVVSGQATTSTLVNPSTPLTYGLAGLSSYFGDANGAPDIQAAGHPSSLTTSFDVTSVAALDREGTVFSFPTEDTKDIVVDLPAGFVGNPQAVPQCPLHDLIATAISSGCSTGSEIGRVSFDGSGSYGEENYFAGRQNIPVYNMIPEHGFPAEFGFLFAGLPVTMDASVVGNGPGTHVRATLAALPGASLIGFQGAEVTFFGDPAVEDGLSPTVDTAFLTNPSDCSSESLVTSIHVDSYENQGARNPDGTPDFPVTPAEEAASGWKQDTTSTPPVAGCENLSFEPSLSLQPEEHAAGAPSGYTVDLHLPQSHITDPAVLTTPDLRTAGVTLPEGLVVNPSAATGLQACSLAQVALEDNDPVSCPEASKIGTAEVDTPLLGHPLPGVVYLATPHEYKSSPLAPSSLLALYIVIDDPLTGVVLKLPGDVEANAATGQLTATFAENPQLPFEDVKLHFKGGASAPLSNPPTCGTYTTTTELTPWSAPQSGPPATPSNSFQITQGENGAACPSGSAFSPSFTAGTSNNQAGAFSPLSVTFARQDSEQTLGAVNVTMPPGLLGVIKGVAQCSKVQANAGTCGAESLIGETTAVVGAGPDPYTVKGGQVYLTGPYNGGPFGLSIVVPTTAGPFTLTGNAGFGKEVVRASIRINPVTAQITVVSNPLPSILEGIPLQIRTVNVTIDRAGFTFNPSDCAASSVIGTISSTEGAGANVSSPFQAANCAALSFKPSLTISTQAKSSKADGASLLVKIAAKPGEANVAKTDLEIPLGLPARLSTLNKACLAATFAANPAACPEGSFIGTATVVTPVLSAPLTGPVIVVSHGGAAFPDVEMVLQGEGVQIILDGHTTIRKGITYSNFEAVPDAPFSSFEANLGEGPHSIFTTERPGHTNLCAPTKTVTSTKKETKKVHGKNRRVTVKVKKTVSATLVVPTKLVGQNGAVVTQNMNVDVSGCPKVEASKTKTKKTKA